MIDFIVSIHEATHMQEVTLNEKISNASNCLKSILNASKPLKAENGQTIDDVLKKMTQDMNDPAFNEFTLLNQVYTMWLKYHPEIFIKSISKDKKDAELKEALNQLEGLLKDFNAKPVADVNLAPKKQVENLVSTPECANLMKSLRNAGFEEDGNNPQESEPVLTQKEKSNLYHVLGMVFPKRRITKPSQPVIRTKNEDADNLKNFFDPSQTSTSPVSQKQPSTELERIWMKRREKEKESATTLVNTDRNSAPANK